MKIHAYHVFQAGPVSVGQVLEHLHRLPLEQRVLDIGSVPVRMEDAVQGRSTWSVDFAAIRHEGPGRAALDAPIEDFDLQDEEGFGHETALHFSTQSQFATMQYNHFGPRTARIQTYLYAWSRQLAGDGLPPEQYGFGFTPVLKADAADREGTRIVYLRLLGSSSDGEE